MQSQSYENDFLFSCKLTHLHKNGLALNLVLKVRVFGTRKWPIGQTFNAMLQTHQKDIMDIARP